MKYACSTLGFAAIFLVAAGCELTEFQVGMAPQLSISTPGGVDDPSGYWGANFAAQWEGYGVDLAVSGRSLDEVLVTLTATPWLGWFLTSYLLEQPIAFIFGGPTSPEEPQPPGRLRSSTWWPVLKPGLGLWLWSDSPKDLGVLFSFKAGVGVHLNDFTTFGLEYGWTYLFATHRSKYTLVQGLNFTYSLVF